MKLSFEKKCEIGFQYVLDLLEPCSCYGAEYIRTLVPYTSAQRSELMCELDNIQKIISVYEAEKAVFTKLEYALMHLKDIRPMLNKCRSTSLNEVELFEIKRFLLTFKDIYPAFCHISEAASTVGLELVELYAALDIVDPDKTGVPSFYISETCSLRLREIRKEKKNVELLIRSKSGNMDDLMIERTKIAAREEEEELAVKARMSEGLRTYLDDMLADVATIRRIDVIIAKAKLAMDRNCCCPVIVTDSFVLEDMVNPKIGDGLAEKGKSFTPVSISVQRGATVITGANMGGKSVALKTTALNILLALCGIFPFAKKAEIVMLDDIYIISEDLESIDRGLSSFGGEILEFNTVVKKLDSCSMVVLDEFARGTNPDEGAAIVKAATKWLQGRESYTILSTHYDGVAEHAGAHYQVIGLKNIDFASLKSELACVEAEKSADRIAEHMDYGLYKVLEKQDCPRDALNICRLLDLEPEIVELAEKNIDNLI
ncbi:MAG: hypothetical protein IJE90_02685 [Clostridia bacterium]|nr:hypothetical protein [Clostridia bacterium]